MLWILPVAAAILLLVMRLRHPRPLHQSRNAPLEETLPDYLQTLAARPLMRAPIKLHKLFRFEQSLVVPLRHLSTLQQSELLPASLVLYENGRLLQEAAAATCQQLKKAPPLPAFEDGESRIGCFARAFFAHNNATLTAKQLKRAIHAWQQKACFTVRELDALVPALRAALLSLLSDIARECTAEQRIRSIADQTIAHLQAHREKQAAKLFQKYRHHHMYLSRLAQCIRKAPEGEVSLWMQQLPFMTSQWNEHTIEEERSRQSERVRWAGNAIESLKQLDSLPWQQFLEEESQCHQLFLQDTIYAAMDGPSRAHYRLRAGEIGRLSHISETMVCETVLQLAKGYPAEDVRSHIGYYLLEDGFALLLKTLQLKPRIRLCMRFDICSDTSWRVLFFTLLALCIALQILSGVMPVLWLPAGLVLSAAVLRLAKPLVMGEAIPKLLPRIALETLPESARTLVVCPVVLTDPSHALKMVRLLSIVQKANPDPNLHFLLLGDFQDSMAGSLANDEETVSAAAAAIRSLKTGHSGTFYYFQRERVYHLPDHVHLCRERRRGALETVMRLMEGMSVEDHFAYASIQPDKLAGRYRYLITLDEVTFLPPGEALRLVGTMLHPLQQRCVLGDRLRGVSAVQPRIGTALAQTMFARLFTADERLVYKDWFGQKTFLGKGIIDPKAMLKATDGQMITEAALCHAPLEGLLGGCAYAEDIDVFEGSPESIGLFLENLHQHTKAVWQLAPYVLSFTPKRHRLERNALLRCDKRRIRHALGATLLYPLQWFAVVLCILCHQPWLLCFCLGAPYLPIPYQNRYDPIALLVHICLLPAVAMRQLDAIARALYRLFISRQRLLEGKAATELSRLAPKPDMRFFYMCMAAGGSLALLCILPGALRLAGIALAALWASAPFWMPATEKPLTPPLRPTGYMREVLIRLAKSTLLFFETAITPEDHALPPESVQIEPNKGILHHTTPLAMGYYLCALLASERLELLSADEIAHRIRPVIEAMEQLPKWRGHFLDRYDTRTLLPISPQYVSTAASGTLAVCLTTAAQGMRCLLHRLPEYDHDLASRLDALAEAMQFEPLFDKEAMLFYRGFNLENEQVSEDRHHLLAGDGLLSSFYAVITGQVPLHHWFRLGRTRVHTRHGQTLLTASGSLFEYLCSFLFHPPADGSLLTEAAHSALRLQFDHALQGVSGVSDSSYYAFDHHLYYRYKAFGLDRLALDAKIESSVIAPYATLLAITLEPKAAFANLLHMQSLGMEGPLGLFEAADFDPVRIGDAQPMQLVHSHMAHHQGIILCAICNFLCDHALAGLFFHLPKVQAYRLLLEEPMMHLSGVVTKPLRRQSPSETPPEMFAAHPVPKLQFPIQAHVLHGADATLLIDAQGGGYLRKGERMLTRFQPSCHIPSGIRFYLKDSQTGQYWQAAEPAADAVFETAQAVFQLVRDQLSSSLRIFLDPLSGMAVHALTVENLSENQRMIEVCSYLEPSLLTQSEVEAAPANCTCYLESKKLGNYGVCAWRRPLHPHKEPDQLWHILTSDAAFSVFHIQTDQNAFLGRERTLYAPRELEMPLSSLADATGPMAEPCLSLRGQFVLQPSGKARFVFVTGAPKPNENPSAFLLRCDPPDSVLSWYDAALTQALVTAQTLHLTPEEQALLPPLCGLLTYTGQPSQTRWVSGNTLPLEALQEMGLTSKLPILVLECHEDEALPQAALLLKLHAFCHMSGLPFDLVFLCCEDANLLSSLSETIDRCHSRNLLHESGGVHLIDHPTQAQRCLVMAAARLALMSNEGSVAQQLEQLCQPAQARPVYRQKASKAWKLALPAIGDLLLCNGYGGFTQEEGNYVITLPPGRQTPAPWCNPLCNEHFGTFAGENGLLFSTTSNQGSLTRLPRSTVYPAGEENFYLRDESNRLLWSLTRHPLGMGLAVRITHAPGETIYECSGYGILGRMHCFTDLRNSVGLRIIHLKNEDSVERILTFCHSFILTVGSDPAAQQLCRTTRLGGGLCMENPQMKGVCGLCTIDPEAAILSSYSVGAFGGLWGIAPAALSSAELPSSTGGNAAMLLTTVQLKPGESKTITCALAYAAKRSELVRTFQRLRAGGVSKRLHRAKQAWEHRLSALLFDLPDAGLSLLLSRWLPLQARTARLFGHSGSGNDQVFFHSQLEDMLCLLHTEPAQVRRQLLDCAAHQFVEGDVMQCWEPEGNGLRTRLSGDPLLLPYLTALYVTATGDSAVLKEQISYLQGDLPNEEENERYLTPKIAAETSTLQEHCLRAIYCTQQGLHGIPMASAATGAINGEDSESVWLGMFLCEVLRRFSPLCEPQTRNKLLNQRQQLLKQLDETAWDGSWYLRGWGIDGKALGSAACEECRIDLLPQCWAVLCGVSRDRCQIAMENVWRMLRRKDASALLRFAPPFDDQPSPEAVLPPGIGENGGQYTTAVVWAIAALHQLGQDDRAWELALELLPLYHASTQQLARRYRAEPYVMADFLNIHPAQRGRGSKTWGTSGASWFLYTVTEQLLGFQKTGNHLRFRPVLPKSWDEIHLRYRFGETTYHLHASRDIVVPTADGQALPAGTLLLRDDGRIHEASFPIR